jgi:hypothetical protein
MRIRTQIAAFTAATAAAVTGLATSAAPAHASGATYNYIVMPTWQGNCPGGGSVAWVGAASWSASTSGSASDWGDDIVYLRVGYYEPVTITGNVICRWWWGGTYNGPAVSVTIYPTRYQQSWYIGPKGVSHN